jgi:hypothetical protein
LIDGPGSVPGCGNSSIDCNENGIPDECETDCNGNGVEDSCDIADESSDDCNENGVPDECDEDCNENGVVDECEIFGCGEPTDMCPGTGDCCDVTGNDTPGCDCARCCEAVCLQRRSCCENNWDSLCALIAEASGVACDCGGPGQEWGDDCDANGRPDDCDLADGTHTDCDGNLVPDACEPDADEDGVIDECDGCAMDQAKASPGVCGCGVPDVDGDFDTVPDCVDECAGDDDRVDENANGIADCLEFPAIPTTSTWGLAILTLTLLVGAKISFGRRMRSRGKGSPI